jgi:large subunit ribosomal protein L9
MPTQVVLTSNVKGLGSEGDQVAVADGHARNYLFPHNLAIEATPAAMRRIESLKLLRAERERKELEQAQELATKIGKISCTVELQTGEGGKVFGSVTNMDIANALINNGFQIDKKAVLLDDPIKKVGSFEIPIRLHPQVNATFKLTVISPNAPAPVEEQDSKSSARGKGRTAKKKTD